MIGEHSETVEFKSADGIAIGASLGVPSESKGPAVIFIHEGESDRSEWRHLPLRCIGKGWCTLAYDIRGHGESGGQWDDAWYTKPDCVTKDLVAATEYLRQLDQFDVSMIGVVGASIGGNIACAVAATGKTEIATTVSLSAKTAAVQCLAGESNIALGSCYHIASQGDEEGDRSQWAHELFSMTSAPRKLEITEDDAHGVSIFEQELALTDRVMTWLERRFIETGHPSLTEP